MTETATSYGNAGVAALVAAAVIWSLAVVFQQSGEPPSGLTQGIGLLSLALLVVGMGALLKMMVDLYADEEL